LKILQLFIAFVNDVLGHFAPVIYTAWLKVRIGTKCFKMPPYALVAGFNAAGIIRSVKEPAIIAGNSSLGLPPLAALRVKAYKR